MNKIMDKESTACMWEFSFVYTNSNFRFIKKRSLHIFYSTLVKYTFEKNVEIVY